MASKFVALVGVKHYFGTRVLKVNQIVTLQKDLENEYDDEAISVSLVPIGKVGYVANSTYTVPKGCSSAGRIYDSFNTSLSAVIRFVLDDVAIIELLPDVPPEVVYSE